MKAKLFYSTSLLFSVLFLNACTVAKGDTPQLPVFKQVQVQTLEKTQVSQSIQLTGNVSGRSQTLLSAKAPGRIEAVYADVGDSVKKGDLLVELSGDEASVNLESTHQGYRNALSNLEHTRIYMNAQVESASKNIETLKLRLQALENTRKSLDEITARQIALAEEQVTLTETRLENVGRSLDNNQTDVQEQKVRMITQATILTHNVLDQLLGMLNISAGNINYETDLSARFGQSSHQARIDTLNTLKGLRNSVQNLKNYYNSVIKPGGASNQDIEKGFNLAKGTLDEAKSSLEVIHGLFLHTVTSESLSQSELSGLRSTVVQLGQQVENLLLSVSGGQTTGFDGLSQTERGLSVERENQKAEFKSQLNIASQQLMLARETRRQKLSDLDDNLLILKSQIMEAKNAKQTATASRDAQIQLLKTQADQIRGQLSMAEVAYQNTLVRAPADGIIMTRTAEEGTVVAAGMSLMEFANSGSIKIETEVTEEEAAQLKIGMTATFTVDSLPGQTFSARLSRLGMHADSVTRKVPVEFEVIGHSKTLKIGAFARLLLPLKPSTDLLLVPDQALLRNDEGEFVFIIQKGTAYEVAVKTGRRHSDKIEVISGLYPGNQVVVSGLEGLVSGDRVEIHNSAL